MWRPSAIATHGSQTPHGADAVERLGDQPRGTGLADPAHPRHQKGVGQPIALDRIGQRPDHRLLADQFGECLRPVLAGQDAIGLRGGRVRLFRNRRFGGGCLRFAPAEQRRLPRRLKLRGAGRGIVLGQLVAENVG
jgi:hypothetical protein